MNELLTRPIRGKRHGLLTRRARLAAVTALAALLQMGLTTPAHAVDGCTVLLCMAGAWKKAPQAEFCVPPVLQAFRDVARGRSWPTCPSAGAGNNSALTPATEATCPPFYSQYMDGENGPRWIGCKYPYVVTIMMNGSWYSDTFTDADGNTSTHYSDYARTTLGADIDPTYDNDAAAYVPPPPPPPPCPECGER